jgi:hypothetical protein
MYGLREIATGIAILNSKQPAVWMWGRVAGDALDLATLGASLFQESNAERGRTLASLAAVAGVTVLDLINAGQLMAAARLEG